MKLIPLTQDYPLVEFDCGDSDLNDFLLKDAKHFLEKRIANTFVLEDEGHIVAYFCLLNDKISRLEITNSKWKRIKDGFPEGKQFRSYPTIKIGRFAVSLAYRKLHIGSDLMDLLKGLLKAGQSRSAFRFITVDAYLSAIPFYQKNGFVLEREFETNEGRKMFEYRWSM